MEQSITPTQNPEALEEERDADRFPEVTLQEQETPAVIHLLKVMPADLVRETQVVIPQAAAVALVQSVELHHQIHNQGQAQQV